MALTPTRLAWAAAIVFALDVGASAAPSSPSLSDVVLQTTEGRTLALGSSVRAQRLTAVVFFSAACPCFTAHRARLAALARELEGRGVRFVVVDSERHAPGEPLVEAAEAGLPIWRDDGARLARRLDARYATETFVFDATGALRYRGGIDSDRKALTATPRAYLRAALARLLQASAPPFSSAKALGCALRLR